MTIKMNNLYAAAKQNLVFQESLRLAGEEYYKPSFLWTKTIKLGYAMIYMGWLVAKGEWNENDYS